MLVDEGQPLLSTCPQEDTHATRQTRDGNIVSSVIHFILLLCRGNAILSPNIALDTGVRVCTHVCSETVECEAALDAVDGR